MQAVCRKPSCFLLICRAVRWRTEFQLFPFRTGVCGHRQKSSLAEPQRQLARPSAHICRKGRLVLTDQGPCSQPVPLTEPSASRAAAWLWNVPVGAIRREMLLRSISDPAIILIMLAGQRGNSQRGANPLLWADPNPTGVGPNSGHQSNSRIGRQNLKWRWRAKRPARLGLHGAGVEGGGFAGRDPRGWRRTKQETGGAGRVFLPTPLCDAQDPVCHL